MNNHVILLALFALAGCGGAGSDRSGQSPGDVAARLYEEQLNAPLGSYGAKQRCNVARDAAGAFLQEGNSEQYQRFKSIESRECADAEHAQKVLDKAEKAFDDLENSYQNF